MKIALIEPPYRYAKRAEPTGNGFNSSSRFIGMMLKEKQELVHLPGVAYVGAVLQGQGHDVKIIDFKNTDASLKEADDSDVVGLSSSISCYSFFKDALPMYKSAGKKIVVGGPFISSYGTTPRNLLMREFPEIDYAVMGEGELTMSELVKHIEDPSNPIPKGVLFRDREEIRWSGAENTMGGKQIAGKIVQDLDDLPVVNLSDWPGITRNAKDNFFTAVFSRGCYNSCSFCYHYPGATRSFSTGRMGAELKRIHDLGPDMLMFADTTFTYDRGRTMEIAGLAKANGLGYGMMTRVNDVDHEMMKALKVTGCRQVLLGIESFDEEVLRRANKNITLPQIYSAIDASQKAGIQPTGFILLGLPGETRKSLENTIMNIRKTRIVPRPRIVIPLPGTKIYDDALKAKPVEEREPLEKELLKRFSDTESYDAVGGNWVPLNLTDGLSDQDLLDARDEIYRLKDAIEKHG